VLANLKKIPIVREITFISYLIMTISEFQFNLLSCSLITPRVKHFVGKIQSDAIWQFTPGQFITIIFEHNQKKIKRSYSIANQPNPQNIIEFAASYVENGPGTEFLFNLHPGDSFTITGPFGRLVLKEPLPQRLFLVGTSTGITPYRSMLNELTKLACQIEIIQGVSNIEDILFEDDFLAICNQNINFSVAVSRELSNKKHHFHGRLQAILSTKKLNPQNDIVYLCGNPQMIDETTLLLQEQNFPIQNIIREKYISR